MQMFEVKNQNNDKVNVNATAKRILTCLDNPDE